MLEQLPIKRQGLTAFTFSRYLVPYLCRYEGRALFVDADILCRGDITVLEYAEIADGAVHVVTNKNPALRYERPSVMLFDNERCKALTPEYIESGNPQTLEWADRVGELPSEWNHLVGYDEPDPNAKLVHFTQGIPCFPETKGSEFAAEWIAEHRMMNGTVSWAEIMGNSVHRDAVLKRLQQQK